MSIYHKIQTVWLRDPANKYRTLIEGAWAWPEFEYLKNNRWIFTEKVDGTNIRYWPATGRISGKTDNAQIPAFLVDRMRELFPRLRPDLGDMILYGEGYGAKIQKGGGNYKPNGVDFVLFDVWSGGLWLERNNVHDIAEQFRIGVVPELGQGRLLDAIEYARTPFSSTWGDFRAEGLVMRPAVELLTRRGKRIITKIKTKDFAND